MIFIDSRRFREIPIKIGKNIDELQRNFDKIKLIQQNSFGKKLANFLAIFIQKIELRERCKGVHFVDLGESFPTHVYLQNLSSIQPRMSPSKLDSQIVEIDPALRLQQRLKTSRVYLQEMTKQHQVQGPFRMRRQRGAKLVWIK